MAIQSQFHKDMSKYEPPFIGSFTKRQLKMGIGMIPGIALIIAEAIFIQGISFWILSIITAILFLSYPVLVGLGKWTEIQKGIEFSVKYQERFYQSGQIRRYEKHEFIPKQEIKETDEF